MSVDKDEYVEKLKSQLDGWSSDIDNLEAKAKLATAELSAQYQEQLDALKIKRDEAMEKMNEIQNAAGEAWEELKKGGGSAWSVLKNAASEAVKKFYKS